MTTRKPYPSDVSDEEWAFVAPYLALVREDAPQRNHDLRVLLRLSEGRAPDPTPTILDSRTLQPTPDRAALGAATTGRSAREGYEATSGGGHTGTPARLACESSQRAGA